MKNKANREMRNMNSDEDLSQNFLELARKTNPKSRERCSDRVRKRWRCDEAEDHVWRD